MNHAGLRWLEALSTFPAPPPDHAHQPGEIRHGEHFREQHAHIVEMRENSLKIRRQLWIV